MNNDDAEDINDFVPSLLNPRRFRIQNGDFSLTQNSIVSRSSLSLRRNTGNEPARKVVQKPKNGTSTHNNYALQTLTHINLLRDKSPAKPKAIKQTKKTQPDKENVQCNAKKIPNYIPAKKRTIDAISLSFSAIEDLDIAKNKENSSPFSFEEFFTINENGGYENGEKETSRNCENNPQSIICLSSNTELEEEKDLNETVEYDLKEQAIVSVTFAVKDCDTVNLSTNKSNIKNVIFVCKDNTTNIDCEMMEGSIISLDSDPEDTTNIPTNPQKSPNVTVNLEIKRKKLADNVTENSKVLILNTDDISKLSHVIVQPPNYKLVKRKISNNCKLKNSAKRKTLPGVYNVNSVCKVQRRLEDYWSRVPSAGGNTDEDVVDMSKNLGVSDAVKCDRVNAGRREGGSPRSFRLRQKDESPRRSVRVSSSDAQRVPSKKNESVSSQSPRKNTDSLHFSLPGKLRTVKTNANAAPRTIPHYKIVAGTHFAVDAFSYGEIPNVKHYFLTHFHSDHYSGLKKGFNKLLFCSKITADLCITRLGVNPKCIHVINMNDSITVDDVEVTAVDANHCPGAVMLVFSLPGGKTLLHTGDFRASPHMESCPVFWNKDINTIYLDTTYCNPRYDFPTQDQSLEMALYLLRQKKMALEKAGKKFSSVLIVCGTYTIGKEKFFLGMARRVGCAVWACPEKDRVLQAVEGRSFGHAPPHACQLHVVPMRDLTHEKLRSYLDSLQGAFHEVVAFKPSGWENGKNNAQERDNVTIHGVPYSEHSSFSELIRFVNFLKPKQVVPTVEISGGVKAVQKYFPCPLVCKEDMTSQSKVTDYFSIQNRQQGTAVT